MKIGGLSGEAVIERDCCN